MIESHIPSFLNRLTVRFLYKEFIPEMEKDYGPHWLLKPTWQPGSIERWYKKQSEQKELTKKVLESLPNIGKAPW